MFFFGWTWVAALCLCLGVGGFSEPDLTINCFSLVDESRWGLVVKINVSSLTVDIQGTGPQVRTCLNRQHDSEYQISVSGDDGSDQYLDSSIHSWRGGADDLKDGTPTFLYLIYGGRYRLEFARCGLPGCREEGKVYSDFVNLQSQVYPWCSSESFVGNSTFLELDTPTVQGMSATFTFSFSPCSPVLDYDTANVTLFSSELEEDCGQRSSPVIYAEVVPVILNQLGNALVSYQSPQLKGDKFYCVSLHLSHISCRLHSQERPNNCYLVSDPVYVPSLPPIAALLPMCTSHLACAWLYITVGGTLALLLALSLAVICVRCCERRREDNKPIDDVDFAGGEDFCLTSIPDRLTWTEVHEQWEKGEGVTRGRLLLLYSPDTKLFRELQEALKSFLDLACHCDVYDLFDDALFDTIALDPSEWMEEFLADRDVKIILVSSIGAHRRQKALLGDMPLNLPSNCLLDGLFTSGLRFLSSSPPGLAGRVATIRYEMLHLTEEGHRIDPPVDPAPEFIIPTHLHQLFCWVHNLQPLDLMGKPWVNYHLEMQLLQDALKLVRRDRTNFNFAGTNNGLGNGFTII